MKSSTLCLLCTMHEGTHHTSCPSSGRNHWAAHLAGQPLSVGPNVLRHFCTANSTKPELQIQLIGVLKTILILALAGHLHLVTPHKCSLLVDVMPCVGGKLEHLVFVWEMILNFLSISSLTGNSRPNPDLPGTGCVEESFLVPPLTCRLE
ncbi:hypothetical protein CPB84DRAFT_1249162 [Gymnopilus junonius]|uniref:Uncharacterized protein n=1 Tax=Gymnopilus junonius TaxID=109634 RepID=A0A9P5NNF3_GYMJU|nr:hypothetical protein CPB84DRAFT_1249162 [Gymnopilus junonius]